jgi:hypothetical protein
MTYNADQIRLIDARIAAYERVDKASGTLVSRDTSGPGATVAFDGSQVAMPCRVSADVLTQPGDRVVLQKYGSDWVVVGSFGFPALGSTHEVEFATAGTTTSSSYSDMSVVVTPSFVKYYDATQVRLAMIGSCYSTATSTSVRYGIRFNGVDYHMGYTAFSIANNRIPSVAGWQRVDGIPAGEYTLTARWRRNSGTGTLTTSTDDLICMEADEIFYTPPPP